MPKSFCSLEQYENAWRLYKLGKRPIDISRELKINYSTLRNWFHNNKKPLSAHLPIVQCPYCFRVISVERNTTGRGTCTKCGKIFVFDQEKYLQYSRRYNTENKEVLDAHKRLAKKGRRQKLRLAVIARMGNHCARCGFSDWRALQIDHINGGGYGERSKHSNDTYLAELLKMPQIVLEQRYQLLCANCNWIKRYENSEIGSGNPNPFFKKMVNPLIEA